MRVFFTLILLSFCISTHAETRLDKVRSFAFGIGVDIHEIENLNALKKFGLVVVDGETERESIRNSCSAGALPFVSDINLDRIPPNPYECG